MYSTPISGFQPQSVPNSPMGRWAGHGSNWEVCGAMGRARKQLASVWGDGQGTEAMGRCAGAMGRYMGR